MLKSRLCQWDSEVLNFGRNMPIVFARLTALLFIKCLFLLDHFETHCHYGATTQDLCMYVHRQVQGMNVSFWATCFQGASLLHSFTCLENKIMHTAHDLQDAHPD